MRGTCTCSGSRAIYFVRRLAGSIFSQDFAGLNPSRRQLRNQPRIRWQEIIIAQLSRQYPRNLLETLRRNLLLHKCRHIETNLQLLCGVRILVPHSSDFRTLRQRDAQLFLQLARQGRFCYLSIAHFPAWKFPFQRRGITPPPLPNQQPPVLPLKHRRDNANHDKPPKPFNSLERPLTSRLEREQTRHQ
jgi:hypothetical protein